MNLLQSGVDPVVIALWLGHFSGDPKLSLVVSLGGDERGSCRSFCIACATWTSVRDTVAEGCCREVVACRTDRHARLLDRGRRRLGAGPGCRRLPLSLIHISEPTRLGMISYAVF